MKKSLLSIVLAALMCFSCFALSSCQSETEVDNTGTKVGMTLTLWLPAAEGTEVNDEAVVNVENAINEYTQKNFSTAIKLKVFAAEDYDSMVLSKIYEIKAIEDAAAEAEAAARRAKRDAKKNGTSTAQTTEKETESTTSYLDIDETDPNKYIIPDDENGKKPYDYEYENAYLNAALFTEYPSVESNQFDIFLVHGYEEFSLLYSDMLLSDLSSNYANDSKELQSYINGNFILGAIADGSLYTIPNNRAVGEVGVMLINKKVCEELYYDPTEFDSVEKLFTYDNSGISFIEDVKNSLPDIVPVAGNYTPSNLQYLSLTNDSTFSLLCALVSPEITSYSDFGMSNVFRSTNFINAYRLEKRINDIVKPVDFDTAEEFAVGFFKGTYDQIEEFADDYEIVTLQLPQLTKEDVYDTAFAVSAYTKNLDRAMEIVTAINTNTELRTILQYGKEGVHWRYDVEDTSVIQILDDSYKMDMKETGNAFVTYPAAGVPISAWASAKNNNTYLYLPYTYGFSCLNEDTEALLQDLAEKSAEIYARIEAMSFEEFNNSLDKLRNEVDSIDSFKRLSYVMGTSDELDRIMKEEQSLPSVFLIYVNERGW